MMKSNYATILLLLFCGLFITNVVNAQWSRSAPSQQTYLTNTGDFVGIGTANPLYKLDVQSSGIATMQFKSTNNNASILLDRGSATSTASLTYKSAGAGRWQTGIIANDNFNIRNNILAAPAITCLSANNNVGIGTANPTERLHVAGNLLATGNIDAVDITAGGVVNAASVTTTGDVNAVNFIGSGNIDVTGYIGFGSVEQLTDGGANTIASNSNIVPFVDCGANLGTSTKRWNNILACGNIGLGITAPVTKLHITGGTDANLTTGGYIITGDLSSISLSIDNNEIKARNNGAASNFFLNNSGGNVIINGAGTGNAGIGTTAPAIRLHVRQSTSNKAIEWQHESTADFWTVGVGTSTLNCRFEFNGTGKGQISSVDGTYSTVSDERLKEDISPMASVLEKVMQLNPANYYYKDSRSIASTKSTGFIAQEVEKVFPELIHNDDEGYKWLSYSEFAVIAIKAIQEQEQLIQNRTEDINNVMTELAELKETVSKLDQALAQCCMNYSERSTGTGSSNDARLEQNAPNPFTEKTVVKFYIPKAFKWAAIKIYSMNGEEMKSFTISAPGFNQVEISGNTMVSGVYQYTLLIDGKAVDSKQMILTK